MSRTKKAAASVREQVLLCEGVTHLETCGDYAGAEVADLVLCQGGDRRSCYVMLCWRDDRVVQAELFLTEAEARACLRHGRALRLSDFALPKVVSTCL